MTSPQTPLETGAPDAPDTSDAPLDAAERVAAGEELAESDAIAALSAASASGRLAEIRGRPLELFRFTDGGNGDRFASRWGHRVLAHVDEAQVRRYFVADETNLWARDQTGLVARASEAVLEECYRRADELDPPADLYEVKDGEPDEFAATRETGQALRAWTRRSDTVISRRSAPALATDKYGLRVAGVQAFDGDRRLVAAAGGRVVVLTGGAGEQAEATATVRDRRLEDMCLSSAQAEWRPEVLESPPDLVKQFVETFLPEPGRVELLFKLLGHALTGGNPNRYFVILKGGTTSGKTQLVAALQRTLGGYVGTSPATIFRTSKDDKPRPDVIRMYRKRLAFLPEASKKSWELHASRIKQFTGGDQDPQRAMRSDVFVEERPLCMPVVYTNELPKIVGMDEATKRRIIVPTMDHTLPKHAEDTAIKERFVGDSDVAAWLLAALVRGWLAAQREGLADVEREFSLSTGDGIGELYHLSDFMEWARESERLAYAPAAPKNSFAALNALHGLYTSWCQVFGSRYDRLEQLGLKEFNAELRANHEFTSVKSSSVTRWDGWQLRELALSELAAEFASQRN